LFGEREVKDAAFGEEFTNEILPLGLIRVRDGDVPVLRGLQAFHRKNLQYFLKAQGLVNHVGQPLIKHANRSDARNIRLTSLLKRIPSRA
jgi:hypothetical protein